MAVHGIERQRITPPPLAGIPPRLARAAHEFEGEILKELLKPLTAGDVWAIEDAEGRPTGILTDFASAALGNGLSEQGGFGIADRILRQLSRSGNQTGTDAVTGNRHFDTGIGTPQ